MSTQSEITRLQTARNQLRSKAVALGIGSSTDKLDALAAEFDGIADKGSVNAQVKEGETYTILPGYYHGGTVAGVSGGGNYQLQEKTITPTKSQQSITSDDGYYGLSEVTVQPIPDAYQNISVVTAGPADVLATKVIVNASGQTVAGTMVNNGALNASIDGLIAVAYSIPAGYTSGGTVSLTADIENALAAI